MSRFDGRVAIVTGAAGGMGRSIATAFAAEGASVVVADVAVEGADETVAQITAAGGNAVFAFTDVSADDAVAAMVGVAVDRFGRLDHAVNAAAIEMEHAPLHECPTDVFDRIIAVNLRSMFLCLKHEITAMLDGGGGTIVNIASTNAFRPQPGQPAYTASKHGVLGLSRSAAIDYAARGVRINALCPGAIDTPMLRRAMAERGRDPAETAGRLSPVGRFGRPDEIAAAALWLCSDDSSFTVGDALMVDGGYLAR